MQFFTSSNDLGQWVKSFKTPDEASLNIMQVVGKDREQDIVQTCRSVFEGKDGNAAEILFSILSRYNITREGKNMTNKIIKEAQMMRQDSVYGDLELKVCPKLPFSVGKRLISTYNCRHYCLDSMVLDDDPNRIYCAEALWRRHVMDKFSREFKDKDGKWVGGYINERFQIFRDDGGNNMQLALGERTRKPRPHQYSTERRLEEGRGEKTTDLTASNNKFVKLASIDTKEPIDDTYKIFDDIIEMKQAGLNDEDIIYKVAEHYSRSILNVASIYKAATKMLSSHGGVVYSHDTVKMTKTADLSVPDRTTLVSKKDIDIVTVADGQKTVLKIETPVVVVSSQNGQPTLQIVDGPDAGKQFRLSNNLDLNTGFGVIEDVQNGNIQDAASEVGLNDEAPSAQGDDFPVEVK